jgi:hypothetical protein
MRLLKYFVFTLFCIGFPAILMAHEGHGIINDNSISHYFTSPLHFIPAIFIVAVIGIITYKVVKRKSIK